MKKPVWYAKRSKAFYTRLVRCSFFDSFFRKIAFLYCEHNQKQYMKIASNHIHSDGTRKEAYEYAVVYENAIKLIFQEDAQTRIGAYH